MELLKRPIFGRMTVDQRLFYNPNNIKLNFTGMKTVEAIEHKDVRDNVLYYLKIVASDGKKFQLVNVGKKTYEAVRDLDKTAGELATNYADPKVGKAAK